MKQFYSYILFDPRKSGMFQYGDIKFNYEPFYVGKGSGDRCYWHSKQSSFKNDKSHKANKIRKILNAGLKPIVVIQFEDDIESKVFDYEIYLIKTIGRNDANNGPLTNMTDGGEGFKGAKYKRPEGHQVGNKNSMYGTKRPDYVKEAVSKANKGKIPWNKDLPHSQETIEKISKSRKGKILHSKILINDILTIYNDIDSSIESLAILYNVNVASIHNIKKGKTWNHITNHIK